MTRSSRTTIVLTVAMAALAAAVLLPGDGGATPRAVAPTGMATVSEADLEAIRATALDYAFGYYEGDGERMERALHPALSKRIVQNDGDTGRSYLQEMGASSLINLAAGGSGSRTPAADRQADVEVLDVFGNTASVRLTMAGWVDYMHVARSDGNWVIVNVLWEMKPRNP